MFTCDSQEDDDELNKFLLKECASKLSTGKPCSALFAKEHYEKVRLECKELEKKELDLVTMGQTMGGIHDQPDTTAERYGRGQQQRRYSSMTFSHGGYCICRMTFLMLHGRGMELNI